VIILLQAGGIFLFYKTEQFLVREEMRELLIDDKAELQKIKLSLIDYRSYKINAHELSVNGKMYDVKSMKFSGDSLELTVINDSKEEGLLEKIKDLLEADNFQKSDYPKQLHQLLALNYLAPPAAGIFFSASPSDYDFLSPPLIIFPMDMEVSNPPPKFA
jgi:hypothetical protein